VESISIQICAILNHRKRWKANSSPLVPRKHSENLVLLTVPSFIYETLPIVIVIKVLQSTTLFNIKCKSCLPTFQNVLKFDVSKHMMLLFLQHYRHVCKYWGSWSSTSWSRDIDHSSQFCRFASRKHRTYLDYRLVAVSIVFLAIGLLR